MESFIVYLILFSVIVILGHTFRKSTIPIGLIFVVTGMLLSFIPFIPDIHLNPTLVLNIFLPLLIYIISAFSSWRDMKKQARPIALLSIGHVVFITTLVAIVIHTLIPQMGWPLAIVLGAIISPPDDVAIVSIAEKMRLPERIFLILEGEGMFNDAAALTIFRLALAAAITHQFTIGHALLSFAFIVIGETLYGIILGNLLGLIRVKIKNTSLHLIAAFITPFLAYIPMIELGGSGIIATAIVGFTIGNHYAMRFTPEYRISATTILPTMAFAIQSILFLLVGLNLHSILMRISLIPVTTLLMEVSAIAATVIVGRFIWVYGFVILLPRLLFPSLNKKDPYPPWKSPFIISWSGMRGGISLAAAVAIPALTFMVDDLDLRDLFIFIVFSIIFLTLVLQGLSLPILIKKFRLDKVGESERYKEHISELRARVQMLSATLHWLRKYREGIKDDKKLLNEASMHIYEYQMLKKQFEIRVLDHTKTKSIHDEKAELQEHLSLLYQIYEIEKAKLEELWQENHINLKTRNKLALLLDHQIQRNVI